LDKIVQKHLLWALRKRHRKLKWIIMLKALELAGFKSFADKTRFDFPNGITVVVGPNGSGKSNIVDAIKWVLGTQSAKSLRGEDMADVIFKGSAAGGRKPSNSAEATLILDNSDKKLAVDSDEIHVTRRVYRSGESEYLINRQACRLKDVKDLFRGSGVGVDAYSLIEQGKVDRMLQASAKDRRAIFEEAAGISRFKAKKVETERRLARVDQNLIRLKDIVDEVQGRHTNLKSQATKAAQYRELTQRMTFLRWHSGIGKHRSLLQQSEKLRTDKTAILESLSGLQEQTLIAKEEVDQCDQQILLRNQSLQEEQQRYQIQRERIASLQSSRIAFQARAIELNAEKQLVETRLDALAHRVELTTEQIAERHEEVEKLSDARAQQAQQLSHLEESRSELDATYLQQSAIADSIRATVTRNEKESNELESLRAIESGKLQQYELAIADFINQIELLNKSIESQNADLAQTESDLLACKESSHHADSEYSAAQEVLEQVQVQLAVAQEQSISAHGRLQGTRERLLLLQQLDEQQEGVGRGAKRLLELAKEQPHSPWNSVQGLVADLIEIDVHLAPLIDVALGQKAETVVLTDGSIVDLVRDGAVQLGGRVSMLRMDRLPSRRPGEKIQLDGLRGVLGRADRLVHTQPDFTPLVQFLLGNTWLVDTLATALDLSHLRGAGLSFVTAECEKIDSDGTVSLGSLQTALGLVSRRSEIHAAMDQIAILEKAVVDNASVLHSVQTLLSEQHALLRHRNEKTREVSTQLSSLTVKLTSERALLDANSKRAAAIHESMRLTIAKKDASETAIAEATKNLTRTEIELVSLQQELDGVSALLASQASDRQRLQESITLERIQLAKIDQQLEGLKATLDQLNRDASERQQLVADTRDALSVLALRLVTIDQQGIAAEAEIESLTVESESTQKQLELLQHQLESTRVNRTLCAKRFEQSQRQVDKANEKVEFLTGEDSRLYELLQQHLTQYLEEYQIDLTDSDVVATIPVDANLEAFEAEMNQLRVSLASVGAVNMEALAELDSLQGRYDVLQEHYVDLVTSKDNLQKIIEKINNDSKRLFSETLDAIRTNFQTLYRRSFGGGFADLVLEEGEDIMDAGVEIVATPPGKTALSNSLLSGGEKALTAVALIMAIFQFKPSPFCILDEVDAPFDEANIGRFVSVLTDFLHMTKFVVVSHSKKTMMAANTIYGVTMQESGVSRQVAVRFEEVDEEGNLSKAA